MTFIHLTGSGRRGAGDLYLLFRLLPPVILLIIATGLRDVEVVGASQVLENTNNTTGRFRYPSVLACDDPQFFSPQWLYWRHLVQEKLQVDSRTTGSSSTVKGRFLVEDVAPFLADTEIIFAAADIAFGYQEVLVNYSGELDGGLRHVRDLQAQCPDHTFDKYLVQHYFRNRGLPAKILEVGSTTGQKPPTSRGERFCLLGYAFAAFVVFASASQLNLEESQAKTYLHLARYLLGDYLAFSYTEEDSGWPINAYLVLKNLKNLDHPASPIATRLVPPPTTTSGAGAVGIGENSGNTAEQPADYSRTVFRPATSPTTSPPPASFHPVLGDATTEDAWSLYRKRIEHPLWDRFFLEGKRNGMFFQPPGDDQDDSPSEDPSKKPTVWQLCIHTATAGEMYNFVNRFVRPVQFFGNSLALDFCTNYNLCPQSADFIAEIFRLNSHYRGFEAGTKEQKPVEQWSLRDTELALVEFLMNSPLPEAVNFREAEAILCTIPFYFCRFFKRFLPASSDDVVEESQELRWRRKGTSITSTLDEQLESKHSSKRLLMYLGLPLHQDVQRGERIDNFVEMMDLAMRPGVTWLANNVYLAELVNWKSDGWIKPAVMRVHGLHTNSNFFPARQENLKNGKPKNPATGTIPIEDADAAPTGTKLAPTFFDQHKVDHDPMRTVLISRVGTSGGLAECVFAAFLQRNGDYPLKFQFLENFLRQFHPNPDAVKQVYIEKRLPYELFHQFRSAVWLPYDTSLMLFWELYSSAVPIFVPDLKSGHLLRWMWGQHTRPDLESWNFFEDHVLQEYHVGGQQGVGRDNEIGHPEADEATTKMNTFGFRPCTVLGVEVEADQNLLAVTTSPTTNEDLKIKDKSKTREILAAGRVAGVGSEKLSFWEVPRLAAGSLGGQDNSKQEDDSKRIWKLTTPTIRDCASACRAKGAFARSEHYSSTSKALERPAQQSSCFAFEYSYAKESCMLFEARPVLDGDEMSRLTLRITRMPIRNPRWCRRVDITEVAVSTKVETTAETVSSTKVETKLKPLLHPWQRSVPEHRPSPHFNTYGRLDPDAMLFWAQYSDWAFYPFLGRFRSIPDLFQKLLDVDIQQTSAHMKRFNERAIVHTSRRWERLLGSAY
ncbi:unnamed protein product [Amoebophrya sp. A25]|nr:unnamed protein product [Amoebophrya sp. A25]|eukprot:GSA25T00025190001.1